MTKFIFEDGKYEIERNEKWEVTAKRHGEVWQAGASQFVGNKLLHAMLSTIEELKSPAIISPDPVTHQYGDFNSDPEKKGPLVITIENVNNGQNWSATSNHSGRISAIYADTPFQALFSALKDAGIVNKSHPSEEELKVLINSKDWRSEPLIELAKEILKRWVEVR